MVSRFDGPPNGCSCAASMWFPVVGPLVRASWRGRHGRDLRQTDRRHLRGGGEALGGSALKTRLLPGGNRLVRGAVLVVHGGAAAHPVFQAMLLRWWVSGLRFGDVSVGSHLRTPGRSGTYLAFIGVDDCSAWQPALHLLCSG
jgi:hypothetical protein